MAGNVAILKHAANVPGCALAIENLLSSAGFSPGVMATVLVSSDRVADLICQETFGPVAAVIRARDTDHAIELANRSPFGLAASIWTANPGRGEELAASIEARVVFVNEMVKSDPRLPFGGVKRSGYCRELAEFGIREFVNIMTT
jgi:succinate-semialdehyde dehydrogenase/glutarate-semialdehyde dehydrogenase